ncbi:hypothetical protein SAMN06272755_1284 [Picosynechococcus sp. OG1]|nr:hypothetical protein SAMN06272755_1284 [Picosynechococcus sp. OG1]SMQ78725.1 hypothetical protein SAMN06272774_0566 [Synechococcus sp. 7002]
MSDLIAQFKNRLIISCQAPADSPLHDPEMIAAIAQACVNQGAVGVRIDSPDHIRAVRAKLPRVIKNGGKYTQSGSQGSKFSSTFYRFRFLQIAIDSCLRKAVIFHQRFD